LHKGFTEPQQSPDTEAKTFSSLKKRRSGTCPNLLRS
jgi:hypothetical protein